MISAGSATRRVRRWTLLPWLVLAIGILASFLLFAFIRDAIENVARLRFERQANNAHSIIENRLHFYVDVLYALKAMFASQDQVSRLRFHRFATSLDLKHRYPGFDAVNFAAYVTDREKKRFENAVRLDTSLDPRGYPQFVIKPVGERGGIIEAVGGGEAHAPDREIREVSSPAPPRHERRAARHVRVLHLGIRTRGPRLYREAPEPRHHRLRHPARGRLRRHQVRVLSRPAIAMLHNWEPPVLNQFS